MNDPVCIDLANSDDDSDVNSLDLRKPAAAATRESVKASNSSSRRSTPRPAPPERREQQQQQQELIDLTWSESEDDDDSVIECYQRPVKQQRLSATAVATDNVESQTQLDADKAAQERSDEALLEPCKPENLSEMILLLHVQHQT